MRNRLLAFLVPVVACAALPAAAAEPARDVCRAQVSADVQSRFGQSVSDIEFTWLARSDDMSGGIEEGQAVVSTPACPGYHYYMVYADQFTCAHTPHYGAPPRYARYMSSGAGC